MTRFRSSFLLASLSVLFIMPGDRLPAQETKTLWVAHRRVDCIGVAPQKCYLIKESQYDDWKFWYGPIDGFDYEEGYAYEILVVERPVDDPAADVSSIRFELVDILLKVETAQDVLPAVPPAPESPAPVAPAAPPVPPTPPPTITERPDPNTPEAAAAPELRGHLTIGAGIETRSFKLCGSAESIWIEDRTGGNLWQVYRDLAGYPGRPVFMVVRGRLVDSPAGGFGAHYTRQLLVEDLLHAATESAGCFDDVTGFAFRASGNEPFWSLEISRRGLVFSELGAEGRTLFPHSSPTFLDNRIIYRTQTRGATPRTLIVRLQEFTCQDTMADAHFSYRASIEIDGRTLEGCAVAGQGEP